MDLQANDWLAALVALVRTKPNGATVPTIAGELLRLRDADAVWRALGDDGSLLPPDYSAEKATAANDLAAWDARGIGILSILDDAYPTQLREIHQAPPVLFYEGDLNQPARGICIVGSRKPSEDGLAASRAAARHLVTRQIAVVSGLADGIDASAHRAALDADGQTVAVIGTGIDRVYPAVNAHLTQEIRERGLVLSQFWPGSPPSKQSFPMRNAVMSGYGMATFVAEASENSGTRIQARLAVEHGRPVILNKVVVENTSWGKALATRPGVRVVDGIDGFAAAVDVIVSERERLMTPLHLAMSFA